MRNLPKLDPKKKNTSEGSQMRGSAHPDGADFFGLEPFDCGHIRGRAVREQGLPLGITARSRRHLHREWLNLYFDVDGLTQDDQVAIRHIWWMIRNKSSNPCASGYGTGQAPQNRNGHQFCVKLNGQPPTGGGGGGQGGGGSCSDRNQHCGAWAASGECQANPGYMLTNCCASCNGR